MQKGKGNRKSDTAGVKAVTSSVLPPVGNSNESKIGKITFDKSKVLGTGCGNTVVFQGKFEDRPVAVKRILRDDSTSTVKEADLLQICDDHSNVIRYYCMETDPFYIYIYIALDLCEATLGDWVEGSYRNTGIDPVQILRETCEGLAHLHKVNVVHRDLKPENVLLKRMTGNEFRAVISDFGFSKVIVEGRMSYSLRSGVVGTNGWIAPEVLKKFLGQDSGISLTNAVDVFAMGCVIYYVLTYKVCQKGYHPFGEPLHRQSNIDRNAYDLNHLFTHDSRGAVKLIHLMVTAEPKIRPPIEAVLIHPLFWSAEKVLGFFTDISNRISKKGPREIPPLKQFEEGSGTAVGINWTAQINKEVLNELNKYRKYNGRSMRDLLRAIRNSTNHFHEMTKRFQQILGGSREETVKYWIGSFPAMLPFTWETFAFLKGEDEFKKYYHSQFNFGTIKKTSGALSEMPINQPSRNFPLLHIPTTSPGPALKPKSNKEEISGKLPTQVTATSNTNTKSANTVPLPKALVNEKSAKHKTSAKWEVKEISKSPSNFECVCTIATKTGNDLKATGFGGSKREAEHEAALQILRTIWVKTPKMILNETCTKRKVTAGWKTEEKSKNPSEFESVCSIFNPPGGDITAKGKGGTRQEAEHAAALRIIMKFLTPEELSRLMSGCKI